MITDKLLEGMCAQVANMAKTELRYKHTMNCILAIYHEGEGLYRMRKVEKMVEETLGPGWLNSGDAKDAVFGGLSAITAAAPPDAIVLCTAIDDYEPTAKFHALSNEDKQRIARHSGHPRDLPQYFQPHDALMVTAQSPERVCMFTQRLRMPGYLLVGEPRVECGPQEGFEGRLKMYGKSNGYAAARTQ